MKNIILNFNVTQDKVERKDKNIKKLFKEYFCTLPGTKFSQIPKFCLTLGLSVLQVIAKCSKYNENKELNKGWKDTLLFVYIMK